MIDFQLNTGNFVKNGKLKIVLEGKMNEKLSGMPFNVEYMLHKDEFRDPHDPEKPMEMWCAHVPQINMAYTDTSEELVFEALVDCFEEDFIRYLATQLVEERDDGN